MNWRWIVPALAAFMLVNAVMGATAYHSGTWNLQHTDVLYGWPAFREVAFVFAGLFAATLLLIGGIVGALACWAMRGGR